MALIDQSSPANARITLGGLTVVVPSIVALRGLAGPDLQGLAQTQFGATFQDGLGATYIWNASDSTPDNGSTVVAPYVGPATGRWNALATTAPAGSSAVTVATIAALKAVAQPNASITYIVQGYYAAGDGGGGEFIWNAASTTPDDGGTILQLTAGGTGRFNRLYDGDIYGAWFGCLPGGSDVTTTLQSSVTAAIANGARVVLAEGSYSISNSIYLANNAAYNVHVPSIIGLGRVVITNTNTTAYAFVIDIDGGQDCNLYDWRCREIVLNSTFGLECGLAEAAGTQFGGDGSGQCPLKGLRIEGVDFEGTYLNQGDPNIDTNAVPTVSSLKAYGIAVKLSKCFDAIIDNCNINGFGIGLAWFGSDICDVRNTRVVSCARWGYGLRIGTFGSQMRFDHCDLLANRRIYGIYFDGTYFDEVINCYMETYTPAACYIASQLNLGTLIADNRFDNTDQASTPVFNFAPLGNMIVRGNRWNPASPTPPVVFSSANYNVSFSQLCLWIDNDGSFPIPDYPGVFIAEYDPNKWNHRNFSLGSAGSQFATWPWILTGANNLTWALITQTTPSQSMAQMFFLRDPTARAFRVRLTGKYINGQGSVQAAYQWNGGSNTVLAAVPLGFINTGDFMSYEYLVQIPNGGSGDLVLTISLNTYAVQFSSIEVIAADFQNKGTASLTAGTVAVADTNVTSTSLITISRATAGGTLGHLSYTINSGVGFTINSSSSTDTSTIIYEVKDLS